MKQRTLEEILEYMKTPEGEKEFSERYDKYHAKYDRRNERHKKYHKLINDEYMDKVYKKYQTDYKKRFYRLLFNIYEYAESLNVEANEKEIEEYSSYFTSGMFIVDNRVIERMSGQGTEIAILKRIL